MTARAGTEVLAEYAPENAMDEPGEVARFYDRCSDLMRELLDELAAAPDRPRIFPAIEDAMGWPRRRIASVLGGVCHLRRLEFEGRRPYHFLGPRASASRSNWTTSCPRPTASRACVVPRMPPPTIVTRMLPTLPSHRDQP